MWAIVTICMFFRKLKHAMEVTAQLTVAKGHSVMGLVFRTSNGRFFQFNDYGPRRQSHPPKQAHGGGHTPKPPRFTKLLPIEDHHSMIRGRKGTNQALDRAAPAIDYGNPTNENRPLPGAPWKY
jgi:hypothetical protein